MATVLSAASPDLLGRCYVDERGPFLVASVKLFLLAELDRKFKPFLPEVNRPGDDPHFARDNQHMTVAMNAAMILMGPRGTPSDAVAKWAPPCYKAVTLLNENLCG